MYELLVEDKAEVICLSVSFMLSDVILCGTLLSVKLYVMITLSGYRITSRTKVLTSSFLIFISSGSLNTLLFKKSSEVGGA